MKKVRLTFLFFFFCGIGLLRADQSVADVQQALKDQGFYYGDVTGTKTADTTAAIRRYQIRNGLQVTGEIDAETLRSLGMRAGASSPAMSQPEPAPAGEDRGADQSGVQSAEISPSTQPYSAPNAPPNEMTPPRRTINEVFLGTPYEMAPPDLQRHVIVGAQTLLARYGFYHSGIDGEFGPGTEIALRTFQLQARLIPDGRLNMPTLAALGLLPGQHSPGFPPRARVYPGRPVYRGEWVPER